MRTRLDCKNVSTLFRGGAQSRGCRACVCGERRGRQQEVQRCKVLQFSSKQKQPGKSEAGDHSAAKADTAVFPGRRRDKFEQGYLVKPWMYHRPSQTVSTLALCVQTSNPYFFQLICSVVTRATVISEVDASLPGLT